MQHARSRWHLAAVVVLLLVSGSGPRASAQPADDDPGEWALRRPTSVVTLPVRRVVGYLALAPATTLFFLYLIRPKRYVLAWATAWIASSGMLLALSTDPAGQSLALMPETVPRFLTERLALAFWGFFALAYALFLRWGALWFRAPASIPAWAPWVSAGILVWLAVSALALHPVAIIAPVVVLMALWQAKGVWVYLRVARTYGFKGALVTGTSLGAIVLGNCAAAIDVGLRGKFTPLAGSLAYLNGVLAAVMALGMHLLVFEDLIEELRSSNDALGRSRDDLKRQAVTDPLTGCFNRRFLEEVAGHELEQHRRHHLPLSMLFIDCDHFKDINDAGGHEMGDRVLRDIGVLLRTRTREADYVFRWGGDEFLVLLSADLERARLKAAEIRTAFAALPIIGDLPPGVDLSVGCVAVPSDADDLGPLIEQADREMYVSKRGVSAAASSGGK